MNITFKNFIYLSKKEHVHLLKIRNLSNIREQMKFDEIITMNNHLEWLSLLKKDQSNIYYAIIVDNIIYGAIYINNINLKFKTADWGIYIKPQNNPFISSLSTYLFIEKIFNELDIQKTTLKVKKTNLQAYKFDLSFGFKLYDTINDYFYMAMTKQQWNTNKAIGYMKLLKQKIDTIQYKFI